MLLGFPKIGKVLCIVVTNNLTLLNYNAKIGYTQLSIHLAGVLIFWKPWVAFKFVDNVGLDHLQQLLISLKRTVCSNDINVFYLKYLN